MSRTKKPKQRVKVELRKDRADAGAANDVWAMDFVHDQLDTTACRPVTGSERGAAMMRRWRAASGRRWRLMTPDRRPIPVRLVQIGCRATAIGSW